MTWWLEDCFPYRHATSAVARYRDDTLSPPKNDSDAPSTNPDYDSDDDAEASWDFADLNEAWRAIRSFCLENVGYEATVYV